MTCNFLAVTVLIETCVDSGSPHRRLSTPIFSQPPGTDARIPERSRRGEARHRVPVRNKMRIRGRSLQQRRPMVRYARKLQNVLVHKVS